MLKNHYLHILLLVFLSLFCNCFPQTIYGVSGLIKTPTTEVSANGKFDVGLSYFYDNKNSNRVTPNFTTQYAVWINIGVIPRVEIGLRFATTEEIIKTQKRIGGFRSFNIKGKIINENEYLPSFALGIQDALGKVKTFNSFYGILSKKIPIPFNMFFLLNLGYGTDWFDFNDRQNSNYRFQGVFGGIELIANEFINLMIEYDADFFNYGLEIHYKNIFFLKAFLINGSHLGSTLNFSFYL
ncbi:MAG: YjbH domain-containing protein [Bacteroidetes bacterium]|nr:YjbH domain-containing protein [Bacteroidota bacterium]